MEGSDATEQQNHVFRYFFGTRQIVQGFPGSPLVVWKGTVDWEFGEFGRVDVCWLIMKVSKALAMIGTDALEKEVVAGGRPEGKTCSNLSPSPPPSDTYTLASTILCFLFRSAVKIDRNHK